MAYLADLVAKTIFTGIKAHPSYVVAYDSKQRDFQFDIQKFRNRISALDRKATSTSEELDTLSSWYVTAARKIKKSRLSKKDKVRKNKKSSRKPSSIKTKEKKGLVIKSLEEKFSLLDKAEAEAREGRELLAQAKSKFGKNSAAKKVLKEIDELITKLDRNKDKAYKVINKIASEQKPASLTDKNKIVKHGIDYIKKSLKEFDGEGKKPKLGNSYYSADRSEKKGVRFSRYIEILNAPKQDGSFLKRVFVVLSIDLITPRMNKGKVSGVQTPLFITILPQDVRPSALSQSFAVIKSIDFENNLAVLAYRNGLNILHKSIKTDVDSTRTKFAEKGMLRVLNDIRVKMKTFKNKFKVIIPDDIIKWIDHGTKLRKDFEEDLYVDVKRVLRQPMGKTRSARNTTDRLKLEKITPKKIGKYKAYMFTFNLLPVGSNQLISDKDPERPNMTKKDFMNILRREMYKDLSRHK